MPLSLFKSCLKPELVNRLNHDAQIVAQHLAKRLIDLRRERATTQALTKLTLARDLHRLSYDRRAVPGVVSRIKTYSTGRLT